VVQPRNYLLMACHVSNETVQLYQLSRWSSAHGELTTKEDSLSKRALIAGRIFAVTRFHSAFIVNIGDMLERWTNGIFRSTLHRVLLSGQERYSVAYFLEPGPDCLVECLPTCQSESNPPKYLPVKYGDYLAQRYQDTHGKLSSSY